MSNRFFVSERYAILLRRKIVQLQKLRDEFLCESKPETAHNLRMSCQSLTAALQYGENELPQKWGVRLTELTKRTGKRFKRICELERDIKLVDNFRASQQADHIAVELLLNLQKERLIKSRKKAKRCLSSKKFKQYKKFLSGLRGSRSESVPASDMLETRVTQFLAFSWNLAMNDKVLGELTRRVKRLRYALEIQQKMSGSKYGRLLGRIRNLQELLQQIQDLALFHESVSYLLNDWDLPDLKLVPSSLERLSSNILERKDVLSSRVYPLFARIVPILSSALHPGAAKPVRSSRNVEDTFPDLSKSSNDQQARVKKFA
jgi:CHAD domain-containing protein